MSDGAEPGVRGVPDRDPDRAALFLEDILATPDVLEALITAYEATLDGPLAGLRALPASRSPRRLALTGMGSSRFAALAFAGRAAVGVELASARSVLATEGSVLVGISNSGRTAEIGAAIRAHRGRSPTIGITNHPDRPVGTEADIALPLLAGNEHSGIACRSYAATLAVVAFLVAAFEATPFDDVARELRAAVSAGRSLREGRATWAGAAADALDAADEIHVIGDGRDVGALEQAALMFREAPRLRALPMDAGDWLHVGLYTMLPGSRAMLFSGTPYDAEVVATITRRGGRFVSVGRPIEGAAAHVPLPDVAGTAARAIVAAGAAELVAVELWSRLPLPRTLSTAL